MPTPLLVFRVGYMVAYDGKDKISSGGAWIEENNEGGEMWNFRHERGRCYGYVYIKSFAGIDLGQIAPDSQWEPGNELDGVDVVFIARKPAGKPPLRSIGRRTKGRHRRDSSTQAACQVVIGWYRGATVFHKEYKTRSGTKGDERNGWGKLQYLCQVDAERAVLLPEAQRLFPVPFARPNNKGFPGQSNIWYPYSDSPKVKKFVVRLRRYIASSSKGSSATTTLPMKKTGRRAAPDKDQITQIEQAAIYATVAYFEKRGYKVVSVEKDNRGWDLEATKNGEYLLIEVKGHIGNVIQFELTPNEYAQLQANSSSYRVCVVRNALEDSKVEVYMPSNSHGAWSLVRRNGHCIQLTEKVVARAFEAGQ